MFTSCASPLVLFLTVSLLITSLIFSFENSPARFPGRMLKRRLNLALVVCVNFMLSYVFHACMFDLVVLDLVFICNGLLCIFVLA